MIKGEGAAVERQGHRTGERDRWVGKTGSVPAELVDDASGGGAKVDNLCLQRRHQTNGSRGRVGVQGRADAGDERDVDLGAARGRETDGAKVRQ